MFTGIVEELGTVESLEDQGDAIRLTVRGPLVTSDAGTGDSISVNGCCLTVVSTGISTGSTGDGLAGAFTADVMHETLAKTSLGALAPGTRVNLERAVTPTTRLGGHIVQGHVDGTGTVVRRTPSEHWELVEISLPAELERYLVPKGSITVDGISLTVVEVSTGSTTEETGSTTETSFTVSLIPETLSRTTLGFKQTGDVVNLEVDVIAKYVEKMVKL
jgi:riboflavin synthase